MLIDRWDRKGCDMAFCNFKLNLVNGSNHPSSLYFALTRSVRTGSPV